MSDVIHDDEDTGWRLIARESSRTGERVVEMVKSIPYDGVLRHSTEQRDYVPPHKNSTFGHDLADVVGCYEEQTGVRPEVQA